MIATGEIKVCSTCRSSLPIDDFNRSRAAKDGRVNNCRKCQAGFNRQWNYGITPEQYERMVIEQDGKCAICEEKQPLLVDHDHRTGKLRKLLCRKCNSLLGMCDDNTDKLQKAAAYLNGFLE